ncbi:MAG TPA: molecular chaperone DnaJ, partial [Anaeromyxobacteraceae bacterium]|nr:molecular chaperone DnaJ [Anaeromyxobacteraceae bacterium]
MSPHERALVAGRALARVTPAAADPDDPIAAAERRVADVLAEVTALDADVERLAAELGDFSRRYDAALGAAFAALDAAERLIRRLQRLED